MRKFVEWLSRWFQGLGNRLTNPVVIDATRSWLANFSGCAATVFGFIITVFVYYGAWTADSETLRLNLLMTALVLTHIEAILCLFYIHRISLEALKAKVGAVEVSLDAQPVQQITVTSPQTVIQAAPLAAAPTPNGAVTTTTVVETKHDGPIL